ncbi:MAG: hypothetical protein AB1641_18580 [Thermodesulfobacteriota bacterium]
MNIKNVGQILLILAALTRPAWAAGPEGEYLQDRRDLVELGFKATLTVRQPSPGLIQVELAAANPALCGGVLSGKARLRNGQVEIKDGECVFRLHFAGDVVRLKQISPGGCLTEQCSVGGEYIRRGALAGTVEEAIKNIRRHYAHINSNLDSYDQEKMALPVSGKQPGGLSACYFMGHVKKISLVRAENLLEEYYFWDDDLIFSFKQKKDGSPAGRPGEAEEDRYYFHQGRMIRWLDKKKNSVPSARPEYEAAGRAVLNDAARCIKALETKNPRWLSDGP